MSQPAYGSPSGLPITLTFTLHINGYDVNLSFSVLFLYRTAGFHTESRQSEIFIEKYKFSETFSGLVRLI
ncbi:hypothetical protein EMIT074MI3_20934 [Bacillus licheniformis]